MADEVVIASGVRTAIGRFGRGFRDVPAPRLGAAVIQEALKRAKIGPQDVDEVIMGNVISAGLGQNPARQAAIYAGLPVEIGSFTVNKVCGSGLKSVMLAAQAVKAGDADVVVAGGMENMSAAPFLLREMRWGARLGHTSVLATEEMARSRPDGHTLMLGNVDDQRHDPDHPPQKDDDRLRLGCRAGRAADADPLVPRDHAQDRAQDGRRVHRLCQVTSGARSATTRRAPAASSMSTMSPLPARPGSTWCTSRSSPAPCR